MRWPPGAAENVPPSHLLYLHGFRSSPQSMKARRMARWAAEQAPSLTFWCPQLPPSPAEAVRLIEAGIAGWPQDRSAVIGSSLGGWYATVIAERHGWPAVLLNPAVEPARDLARYIGEQTAWHDPQDRFFFRAEFIDELRALHAGPLRRPEREVFLVYSRITLPPEDKAVYSAGRAVSQWADLRGLRVGVQRGKRYGTEFDALRDVQRVELVDYVVALRMLALGRLDAVVAPDVAINQGDAPPALRTRQSDVGLRYALPGNLRLVAGLFTISKPYYNLDPAQVFRELGSNSNRGAELSMAGPILPGLNVVAGAVLLDSRISGELVDAGLIGRRPVGTSRRKIIFDADWRLNGGTSPLSFDVSFNRQGAQMANAAGTLQAPGNNTIDLGMRYRFTAGPADALLRVQVNNVTNHYSWNVSSSGGFTYRPRRHFSVAFIADF